MKRVGINIILIVGFGLLMAVIVLPFAAEVEFDQAKKLEVGYRWKRAGEKYQAAVHLNPFNAKYFAGAGDFMVRQSGYRKDKERVFWLERAKKLYERACHLNPQYAETWYLLGKVRLELNEIDEGIDSFREALERDPYSFRINYLVGHNSVSMWNSLDNAEKDFAMRRLKYVLQLKPHYSQYVYPAVHYYAEDFGLVQEVTPDNLKGYKALFSFIKKNSLWQYRKEVMQQVNFYRQKEEPEEFQKERLARLKRLEEIKEIYS